MSTPAREGAIADIAYDETGGAEEECSHYDIIRRWLREASPELLTLKRREAELLFRRTGITFAVYSEGGDPERPRRAGTARWIERSRGARHR